MIPGKYRSVRPINITGIVKIHLKCDCIQESIVNCTRKHFLYSIALISPPGHKINKEPKIKPFKIKLFYLVLLSISKMGITDQLILAKKQKDLLVNYLKYKKSMNLIMISPKNETEHLLQSITRNCETLIKQIHTRPEETL